MSLFTIKKNKTKKKFKIKKVHEDVRAINRSVTLRVLLFLQRTSHLGQSPGVCSQCLSKTGAIGSTLPRTSSGLLGGCKPSDRAPASPPLVVSTRQRCQRKKAERQTCFAREKKKSHFLIPIVYWNLKNKFKKRTQQNKLNKVKPNSVQAREVLVS